MISTGSLPFSNQMWLEISELFWALKWEHHTVDGPAKSCITLNGWLKPYK